ncbi:MAG: homoserine kinase [Rikenellaceae bacterium]
MNSEIKVFAPASVSNIACGFDVMGFAIDEPGDEIVIRISDKPGVTITKITGENGRLPLEPDKNTAGIPLLSMIKSLNIGYGVELEIHKKMPLGSGLGSSAASAVAAAFALNELLNLNLSKERLLPYTIEGEKIASGSIHADNVAPCLYGGFVLIRGYNPVDVVEIDVPENLYCTVIHPQIEISTKEARKILPTTISLSDAVTQWGNTAGLIAGLLKKDFGLIGRSLHDVVIEPVRSMLIPGFDDMKKAASDAGALGCSISGSGPSVFALSISAQTAAEIGRAMQKALDKYNLLSELYVSRINKNGPRIIEIK